VNAGTPGAATPGKAAYEAFRRWYAAECEARTMTQDFNESKYEAMRRAFHAGTEAHAATTAAAPAAPQPAPGNAEVAYEQWIEHRDPADVGSMAGFVAGWQAAVAAASGWPLCPNGCGCRLGSVDADSRDCACDGLCCYDEIEVSEVFAERDRLRKLLADREPQPAPELAEVTAKLAEVAAERDKLLAAPGQRELDSLREKLAEAEQEAADVRACAVHAFAIIAVLARDNPAAQRQANELRERIGMLPSPPDAEIAEQPPTPELIRAMGVIAAYEDYARRMTIPDASARAALRERHGVEPTPELAAYEADIASLTDQRNRVSETADHLRELLDEIGVMAANAPEDGDSFGVLEEIAMRIAAVDVPDSAPEAAAAPAVTPEAGP
jgi:hypothetical protein